MYVEKLSRKIIYEKVCRLARKTISLSERILLDRLRCERFEVIDFCGFLSLGV